MPPKPIIQKMSPYYDKKTNTTYYDSTMVIKLCQKENLNRDCEKEDMRVFIVYDEDEDLIYVYGSRKSEEYPDHIDFVKTFTCSCALYDFLNIILGIDAGYHVNTSVYCLSGLTNYSGFDDFDRETSKQNEISGYDNERLSRKRFYKYINIIF